MFLSGCEVCLGLSEEWSLSVRDLWIVWRAHWQNHARCQCSSYNKQPGWTLQTWSLSQMLLTPCFCSAVLKPLVEMTTIHYKPFENSPHKCHPLSAVSTPRTQGIFKKPNLQLSEILLNSYLFAAGSFCAIPLLCIGAEINHRPCTAHQYDFRLWAWRERTHTTTVLTIE